MSKCRKILLTCSNTLSLNIEHELWTSGIQLIKKPLIKISPIELSTEKILELYQSDWIIVSSRSSARILYNLLCYEQIVSICTFI